MRDRPFHGLTGDRARRRQPFGGSPVSPPSGVRERVDPVGKLYMLLEDFRLHSLPYGGGTRDGFTLALEPESEQVAELIANAMPSRHGGMSGLQSAFRDYVERAIWHLAQGDVYLEIEYFRNSAEFAGNPVAFRIDFLESDLIHRHWGQPSYWNRVMHESTGVAGWKRERLDPEALVSITVPRALRLPLRRALDVVSAADQDLDVMQSFTLGAHGSDSGFDLSMYRRISNDTVLRATREIGWTGRGLFAEDLLDPMKVRRAIQFARVVAQLRDIAISGLREAIARAGGKIGFDATLTLAGVLTNADLDRMEADLRAGTRPISEMFMPKPPAQENPASERR